MGEKENTPDEIQEISSSSSGTPFLTLELFSEEEVTTLVSLIERGGAAFGLANGGMAAASAFYDRIQKAAAAKRVQ
jgi:hypothetical protein